MVVSGAGLSLPLALRVAARASLPVTVHIGRRTGLRHETVLEVVEYRKERREAVVISGFGPTADWLRNIAATPTLEVVIGSHRFAATYQDPRRRRGGDA